MDKLNHALDDYIAEAINDSTLIEILDEWLESEVCLPDSIVNRIGNMFETSRFIDSPNSWKLLGRLGTDLQDDLTKGQKQVLSQAIAHAYLQYNDERLCPSAIDFIVELLDGRTAFELLQKLFHLTDGLRKAVVVYGFDWLWLNSSEVAVKIDCEQFLLACGHPDARSYLEKIRRRRGGGFSLS